MFDSLREKLYSVQENLSTSIRGLSGTDTLPRTSGKEQLIDKVNLNAGTEVLERFQATWAEIHKSSQANAKEAQVVDELIGKLYKRLETQWRNISNVNTALSRLPEVMQQVDNLTERLGVLDQLFVDVEKALVHLNDLIETRELQDRQLDHRFQLALYKEKKLSQLENTRVSLAKEHAATVALHEIRQSRIQAERQEAFEQQFKQDLTLYKETNTVPKIKSKLKESPSTPLEEVLLDNEDEEALNEFLHESTPEHVADEEDELNESSS